MLESASQSVEPIAIVGMACRFPKLDTINELWEALRDRFVAADRVPEDRWDADRYYSTNEGSKGKAYVQKGNFVNQDVRSFDASFFGISPREAENMDPQQRLILEVVWEAFENSGFLLPEYAGKQVGVYVGGFMLDHMITQMGLGNRSSINQHSAAGMMMTMLSNRISHTFDLRGPSLSIDTACSSSLVAFHYACQDVWRGACEMAIVGGTNVMMRPEYPIGMSKGFFLARDGQSKSFDARGDGYGRGEGAGVLLLKPLSKAKADGDKILSVVLGTGTNQDGHTPGISMPNGEAQQALIEQVCRQYQIDPSIVDYVECHGTGTDIGDPTECKAIGATYGKNRNDNPVIVGSIKSNIGHTEAVAGVAGVIKAVLTAMHRQVTPLGNLQQPREDIPFGDLGIRIADDLLPIGQPDKPVTIAVNSFGYGGSNAHVILQSVDHIELTQDINPVHSPVTESADSKSQDHAELPWALPISGRSKDAMTANAKALHQHLDDSEISLADAVYSASVRRAHHSHRAVALGRNRTEVLAALNLISAGEQSDQTIYDVQPFQGKRQPVFVFTGMGPQWWYMGQQLYRTQPLYRETVEKADRIFQDIAGFSILEEMLKSEEESQIQKTIYAQPANLLIQIGIYEMLQAQGIHPGVVVGHSVGELGSAYAAGILSLEDALRVSFHRSQLQAETAGQGGMLAIGLGKREALQRISDCQNLVSVAAVNSPSSVTLAGYIPSLKRIEEELAAEGIFARMLDVEIPYHSAMMDPLMPRLEAALKDVQTHTPQLPIYSTVTGQEVTTPSFGADYWPLNIRQAVEFEAAIAAILEQGYNTFVEIGPHPVLSASLRDCIKVSGKDCRLIHTLRRNLPDETHCIHRAIFSIFAAGCDFDWQPLNNSQNFVALPNYQWQRERYWIENDRAAQDRINPVIHPILGTQEALAAEVWRNDFDHRPVAYLRDHVVSQLPILPAAAYLESLLELAGIQFPNAGGLAVRDMEIRSPMILHADRGMDFSTSYDSETRHAVIRSQENGRLGSAQVNATAKIAPIATTVAETLDLSQWALNPDESDDIGQFYQDLKQIGLAYGPYFQTVRQLHVLKQEKTVVAQLKIEEDLTDQLPKYKIHPTLLDGCFQTLMALLGTSDKTYLPTHFGELCLYSETPVDQCWCVGKLVSQTNRTMTCDLTLVDQDGNVIAVIRSLKATVANKPERVDQYGDKVKLQTMAYQWEYGETLAEPKRLGHWLMVGNAEEVSDYIASRLESFGATISGKVEYADDCEIGFESQIRFDQVDDARRVLQQAGQLNGVVFMGGLDPSLNTDDPTMQNSFNALLTFTQAMLDTPVDQRPRVYIATRAAFDVEDDGSDIEPGSATLNGFARVAANELEGFKFTTVDLPYDLNDEDALEALALELICDADEDEVAVRGDIRWVSELLENQDLTQDVIVPTDLDDQHPIAIRPKKEDAQSVGMVRVIAAQPNQPAENQILIRIEASLLPFHLITEQSEDIEQPYIEIVGQVIAVGSHVADMSVGDRVCGFAPADLTSHMCGDRDDFHLVTINDDADAALLVGGITKPLCVRRAIESHSLEIGDPVLVQATPLGITVAEELTKRGQEVSLICSDPSTLSSDLQQRYKIYSACPEGIQRAVDQQTSGRKFAGMVVELGNWLNEFDMRALAEGGWVIDTQIAPAEVSLPANVGAISRTAITFALGRKGKVQTTLTKVIDELISGTEIAEPTLNVSISDIAWQNLPLTETNTRIVIDYDSRGQDLPMVQDDQLRMDENATYLITGGFGGFGQKTAQWLVQLGARNLVLTGRSGANTPEKKEIVNKLEAMGARVKAAACDTADLNALTELFDEISDSMPPLKGVFHSGAVIMDQAIAESDLPTVNKVMQAKATGAWNLHQLTQDMPLDHFVLYSSLANLIGNSRQGAYCAANGFLNGLARLRHSQGLPATSVNWGAIAEVGVVAQDEKLEQFLRHLGLRGIGTQEALQLLSVGLSRKLHQFGVVLIKSWADWARFESIGSSLPRFRTIVETDSVQEDNGAKDQLIAELSTLDAVEQVDLMATLIQQIVAAVLKSSPDAVDLDRPISELGIDSLMATEIQIQFETNLGLAISVLELIGDTTIRSLATSSLASIEHELQNQTGNRTPKTTEAEPELASTDE